MSKKVLGLDLGITSIGWSLITEESENVTLDGWGARIFEAGMEDDIDAGKGVSRCSVRRMKRALRIQYKRGRERRENLVRILTEHQMLPNPLTPDFFVKIDNRLLLSFPKEIRPQVAHVLPYLYRKKALDKVLAKDELGRTLYHLAQRRGYKSNRKQELKDEENFGVVKSGIEKLKEAIDSAKARTLGEYFCMINPEESRIRTRYTDRAMFEDEFRKICAVQRSLISEELEKELYKAIFFQRKLKSCKNLIGHCQLEQNEKRCSFANEEAQLFRIYANVNHLRIIKKGVIRSLTPDERTQTIEILNGYSDKLTKAGKITLAALAKLIPLAKDEKFTLSDEEKDIYGNVLHANLFRVFGDNAKLMTQTEQKKFFQDLNSIEKEEVLQKRLREYWKLSEEQVKDAMKMTLPDEYCAYSLKALKTLLSDLEDGIPLNTIIKCHYPEQFHSTKEVMNSLPPFDECGIELRNPVVHRTMTELHRVVNTIIARFGIPDLIRIELARNLKNSNKERKRITQQNRDKEKERAGIIQKIIKEAGIENPSRNDILKVMLADECDFTCPYTGVRFSMRDLLYGKDIHIEHIIPYSRSFDDSYRNKTLCEANANASKNNRTPFEAFSGNKYSEILQRVRHFKGPFAEAKLELFEMKEVKSEEFLERNLNDTRYASKLAMEYLSKLFGGIVDKNGIRRIQASAGGCTALIRRAWGGNYLLGEGEKVRSDHRHHAVDALTIAITTPEMVKKVASMTPENRRKKQETKLPLLESNLYEQALNMLDSAAVSHHVVNRIRGPLHKETIYSKDFGKGERHVRIALSDLTLNDIPDIVDPAIRRIIMDKLKLSDDSLLMSANKKDSKINFFADEKNLPSLADKNGKTVNTIRFVRILRTVNARTIGKDDCRREVANGENHLLAVFAVLDKNGNEISWTGEILSLLDARLRTQKRLPLFEKNRPGMKFKFSLKKGDIVSWKKDGMEQLCIIRGVSLPQFTCVPLKDARKKEELQKAKVWFSPTLSGAYKGGMKKYQMNLFGELRRAND